MRTLIDCFECKSIEYPDSSLPQVEVFARVILPKSKIRTIHKEQIAEAVKAACESNIEICQE